MRARPSRGYREGSRNRRQVKGRVWHAEIRPGMPATWWDVEPRSFGAVANQDSLDYLVYVVETE